MSSTPKKSPFVDFRITDRASCERAIRNGGIAALISAGLTAIFGIIGLFYRPQDAELSAFFDPWMLVDVVLMLVLAFFVFRKSRVATTILFLYFLLTKITQWMAMGEPKGLFVALIFFAYYFTAMRATYAWHSTFGRGDASPLPAASRS